MKRIISILICAGLLMLSLSGCGQEPSGEKDTASKTPVSNGSTASPDKTASDSKTSQLPIGGDDARTSNVFNEGFSGGNDLMLGLSADAQNRYYAHFQVAENGKTFGTGDTNMIDEIYYFNVTRAELEPPVNSFIQNVGEEYIQGVFELDKIYSPKQSVRVSMGYDEDAPYKDDVQTMENIACDDHAITYHIILKGLSDYVGAEKWNAFKSKYQDTENFNIRKFVQETKLSKEKFIELTEKYNTDFQKFYNVDKVYAPEAEAMAYYTFPENPSRQ